MKTKRPVPEANVILCKDADTFMRRIYCRGCGRDMGAHTYRSYEEAEFARGVTEHYCQMCNRRRTK